MGNIKTPCNAHAFEGDERIDQIVEQVKEKFDNRSRLGINKYGTTLDDNKATLIEWLNHLQEELMDATLYIQKLKSELDKIKNNMEKSPFELFSNSGRFTQKEVYLEKYPDAILNKKCTDVIVYSVEGFYIQVLITGEFYFNEEIRGYSLDEVELGLWNQLNDIVKA